MRYLILISLTVVCCFNTFAYKSIFGKTSTKWVIGYMNPNTKLSVIDTLYYEKDTVVNSITYKKVVNTVPARQGLFREDTVAGKVWYKGLYYSSGYSQRDTTEILCFDFSLSINDKFDTENNNITAGSPLPDSLITVQKTFTQGGLKYIEFKIPSQYAGLGKPPYTEPLYMIEGIGSNYSVFWKQFYPAAIRPYYLLCSYKDGEQTTYSNIAFNGSCQIPTSVKEELNIQDETIVFPNPCSDQFTINLQRLTGVSIFDLSGKLIKSYEGKIPASFSVSELASGTYLVEVSTIDGKSYTRLTVN